MSGKYYAWLGGGLLLVVIIATAVFIRMQATPDNLDLSRTKATEAGLYQVAIIPAEDPIPINRMHRWTLEVLTADGQPVEDAVITVDGDMPQHMHGLPTRPQVTTSLGNGRYLVEGIRFQMGGWWVMDFEISSPGRHDRVRFHLMLEP